MSKGIILADLERTMGQKASKVGNYQFDPDTMNFGRTITFDLKQKKRKKRSLSKRGKK